MAEDVYGGISPFIPGTRIQYVWDSTSLGMLKTCARLYQYQMIEGWTTRHASVHLKFGILYHSALERFDRLRADGLSYEDAVRGTVRTLLESTWERTDASHDPAGVEIPARSAPWESGDSYKNRATLLRSVIWYLTEFKDDPAATIRLANGKPAVELSFKMELDYGPSLGYLGYDSSVGNVNQPYILSGHIDRLVTFQGGVYVTDRKTTKSALGSHYFDQYTPDNQMTLYSLAAQVVYHAPVKGVIIDAVQIGVGFARFGRGFAYRTPAQLDEWLADTRIRLREAEGYATDHYWPQNDKACSMYGGCPFREVCNKDPSVRKNFLAGNFEKNYWNPRKQR